MLVMMDEVDEDDEIELRWGDADTSYISVMATSSIRSVTRAQVVHFQYVNQHQAGSKFRSPCRRVTVLRRRSFVKTCRDCFAMRISREDLPSQEKQTYSRPFSSDLQACHCLRNSVRSWSRNGQRDAGCGCEATLSSKRRQRTIMTSSEQKLRRIRMWSCGSGDHIPSHPDLGQSLIWCFSPQFPLSWDQS